MMLIAESGATKTTWAIIEKGRETSFFSTNGLSPVTQSDEQIADTIRSQVIPSLNGKKPGAVAFYGTGVSSLIRVATIEKALRIFFPDATLAIEHDLLAAARAAYAGETTITAILGTGSSSCVFDGEGIVAEVPSLGFIIGDEGSGAHMGKMLLRDFIYGKLPASLADSIKSEYSLTKDEIVNHVYKLPDPPKWLASFSRFILANIADPYCETLVLTSFRQFFEGHISAYSKYKKAPFNVIGSIAFHFKNQLQQVCEEYGFNFGHIIQSPIDELVKFHIERDRVGKAHH